MLKETSYRINVPVFPVLSSTKLRSTKSPVECPYSARTRRKERKKARAENLSNIFDSRQILSSY